MPLSASIFLAVVSSPSPVLASEDVAACVAQHETGQLSRRAGHFGAAREAFNSCTADACPAPVRKRCGDFLAELDAAQPTIVIAVRDVEGRDIVRGLSMTIDGGSPRDVPTTALRVDPGEHVLVVSTGVSSPIERPFVVREGERDKRIDLVLGADRSQSTVVAAPGPRMVSTTARVLFGVSAVSLLGAGTTSAVGWGIRSHLASTCSPTCTASQVEPLRVLWPTSFIALGVGVVSGALAATLVLTNRVPNRGSVGFYASENGVGWLF